MSYLIIFVAGLIAGAYLVEIDLKIAPRYPLRAALARLSNAIRNRRYGHT